MPDNKVSFQKGWGQVKQKDIRAVKAELMKVLNINTRAAFHQRRRGAVIPDVLEAALIEGVFRKYGVTNVWGAK